MPGPDDASLEMLVQSSQLGMVLMVQMVQMGWCCVEFRLTQAMTADACVRCHHDDARQ